MCVAIETSNARLAQQSVSQSRSFFMKLHLWQSMVHFFDIAYQEVSTTYRLENGSQKSK